MGETTEEIPTLSIFYTNARSIGSKINDLAATISINKPAILLICETWLNESTSNAGISIPNYEICARVDRSDTGNGIGGGLIVYSRLGIKILPFDKHNDSNFNQYTAFSIMTETEKLNLVFIYRPPSSDLQNLEELCKIVKNSDKNTIIIGDFNLPSINWRNGTADQKGRRLLEAVEEADMTQLVDFPTHNKGNTLDLIITNRPDLIVSVQNDGNLGNSDHCILLTEISTKPIQGRKKKVRVENWSKADTAGIRNQLGKINWHRVLKGNCIQEDWETFGQIIRETVEKYVPTSTQKEQDKPKWLNREIIKLVRKKKRAWKNLQAHRTDHNAEIYKKLEKEVSSKIQRAKRNLEKKLANAKGGNSTKTFANYIKSKTKTKTSIGPLKNKEGKLLTENLEIANELNGFFASMFSHEDLTSMPNVHRETNEKIEFVSITRQKIVDKIKNLRENSAPGPDGITPKLLKIAAHEISLPLKLIFELSLRLHQVPSTWKHTTVVPIFKKGVKGSSANYRPVSLTSIPCKILEAIIADSITAHLTAHNLLHATQHGFICGRSCATNLILFMDKITEIVDRGGAADIFYLDFSKAFDKVPHQRLLQKISVKGIGGHILAWITDWLKARTQAVRVGDVESEKSGVGSGVPQGSVLGPLLFDVFIDDIDDWAEQVDLMLKFADDTKGLKEIKGDSDRAKLQETLDRLVEWALKWCMEFNIPKCKIMHIGRRNPNFRYMMNGQELQTVEEEKDIGVLVTNSLKPTKHCQKAANMGQAVLKQLAKNFHYRDRYTFKKLYIQYVRPHLEFASPAWSPWLEADKNVLEDVQQKAVKMISGLRSEDSYEEKCREIGLDTLEVRRTRQDLVQTFKILNDIDKIKWDEVFTKSQDIAIRTTRAAADPLNLVVPRAKLEIRKNSFFVRAPTLWNRLPPNAKNATSVPMFKYLATNAITTG